MTIHCPRRSSRVLSDFRNQCQHNERRRQAAAPQVRIKQEFDSYIYDPEDPTPGVTSRMRRGGIKGYENITATRNDILVFDTALWMSR